MALTIRVVYYMRMEKVLNLKGPKDLNEKIQWLKIFYRNPLCIQCADKYRVREYIGGNGLKYILNDLYKVYESADDIDLRELPKRFVMKTNHACKTQIICDDKNSLNEFKIKRQFKKWLKKRIGYSSGEYHYNYIKPVIIVERNLISENGILPNEYKIFCFNGRPSYIYICADRDIKTHKIKRACFDFNWKPMDFILPSDAADHNRFPRPKNLEQMYKVAYKLSTPFPFVRVDLYDINGRIIFGELTFTPTGGFIKAHDQASLNELGDLLILPPKSATKMWGY